jgi:hypothetical protein
MPVAVTRGVCPEGETVVSFPEHPASRNDTEIASPIARNRTRPIFPPFARAEIDGITAPSFRIPLSTSG